MQFRIGEMFDFGQHLLIEHELCTVQCTKNKGHSINNQGACSLLRRTYRKDQNFKNRSKSAMVVHSLVSALKKLRQVDL